MSLSLSPSPSPSPSPSVQPHFGGRLLRRKPDRPVLPEEKALKTGATVSEPEEKYYTPDLGPVSRPGTSPYPAPRRRSGLALFWPPSRKTLIAGVGAGMLSALGWGTWGLFKDDKTPTVAQFVSPDGTPGNCRLTERLNVVCNGFRRGSIDKEGHASNVLWRVGHVDRNGQLWYQPQHDFSFYRPIGEVRPGGDIYGTDGRHYGRVLPQTRQGGELSDQAKGAAAILALRADANDGVKRIVADVAITIIRATLEAMQHSDD